MISLDPLREKGKGQQQQKKGRMQIHQTSVGHDSISNSRLPKLFVA